LIQAITTYSVIKHVEIYDVLIFINTVILLVIYEPYLNINLVEELKMKIRLVSILAIAIYFITTMGSAVIAADIQTELAKKSVIERIIRRGTLRVGMATFVPWAMQDKTGKWIGFEIDVAKRLASDMGVKIQFTPTKWEGLIPSLLTGKFDLIIAGMTGTPQRSLKINFTIPYDYSEAHAVINKAYEGEIKTIQDLNNSKYTILLRNGTTAVSDTRTFLPKAKLRLFSDSGSVLQELLNKNGHAWIGAAPEPAQRVVQNPKYLKLLPGSLVASPISIGVKKGDPDALAYLNNWINLVRHNGFIKTKVEYWWKGMDWEKDLQ